MPRTALILLLSLAIVAPLSAPALAAGEPAVRILSYGRYETRNAAQLVKGDRTAAGDLLPVLGHRLIEQTEVITGILGTSFGVELRFENFPIEPVQLTIRILHPPITNPRTGKAMTVSEYDWIMTVRDKAYFGYRLGRPFEISEGNWTQQIVYKGRVIAEKTFKVVVPLN